MYRIIVLLLFVSVVTAAPVGKQKPPPAATENHEDPMNQVEYERYLKQTVELLGGDANFQRKIQNATEEDIKSGRIAEHLGVVSGGIRSKLNEAKRIEIERLTDLHKRAQEQGHQLQFPGHLQHKTAEFTQEDLSTLIRSVHNDIEENRKLEREAFKQHEMKQRYEYENSLNKLNAEERKAAEEKHAEMKKKHNEHPNFNHPGSEQQMKEVWEEDGMDERDFDPKVLFKYHDNNEDGYWDEDELNAFFTHEMRKGYEEGHEEDDMEAGHEERERMREHLLSEADIDGDGMLSKDEFQRHANKHEANQVWNDIESQEEYTPEEYQHYQERVRADLEAQGIHVPADAIHISGSPAFNQAQQQHLQQQAQQQHIDPNLAYQTHPNQGYQTNEIHPNQAYVNQGQVHQNQVHPNQVYQNQQQMHPNQGQVYGNQGQGYPNQGQVYQNQQQMHPNQGQVYQNQGQVPQYQGQVPQYQGQVPQYQGQVPQYQGQIPQGQVYQNQQQIPQNQGQVNVHPNQGQPIRAQMNPNNAQGHLNPPISQVHPEQLQNLNVQNPVPQAQPNVQNPVPQAHPNVQNQIPQAQPNIQNPVPQAAIPNQKIESQPKATQNSNQNQVPAKNTVHEPVAAPVQPPTQVLH